MSRPTVDNDPELSALQRITQALDDAPDVDARERLIVWAVDRFDLFAVRERREWIESALDAVMDRVNRRRERERIVASGDTEDAGGSSEPEGGGR